MILHVFLNSYKIPGQIVTNSLRFREGLCRSAGAPASTLAELLAGNKSIQLFYRRFASAINLIFLFSMAIFNNTVKSSQEVKMPVIHVDFWEGVGEGQVKKMIRGITNVMMDLGVPENAVEVIVYEIPKTHWGVGGEPASDKLKDISPPK
jgi:4-oxalocrotonate tautomerase